MVRIGINGLGIMGRYLMRAIQQETNSGKIKNGELEVVAINDLAPVEQLAPLVAHDSVYHGFPGAIEDLIAGRYGNVKVFDGDLVVNGKRIVAFSEKDPSKIPWADSGVDIVYESTGAFVSKPGVEGHLEAGASKVIFSAPSDFAQKTFVMGVNDSEYDGEHIVSNASCTTNCLAPLVMGIYNTFGDFRGLMTTVHSYTADQNLVDSPHEDPARAYNAALNFIPTSTGAAKAIGKVIETVDGYVDGLAIRGPVAIGSIVDLTAQIGCNVTPDEFNAALREQAEGPLRACLEYREGPMVSSEVLRSSIPSVIDGAETRTIDDLAGTGSLIKVFANYDNIAGYSHQAIKLMRMMGQ